MDLFIFFNSGATHCFEKVDAGLAKLRKPSQDASVPCAQPTRLPDSRGCSKQTLARRRERERMEGQQLGLNSANLWGQYGLDLSPQPGCQWQIKVDRDCMVYS